MTVEKGGVRVLIPETQRHLAVPIDSVKRLPPEENPRRSDAAARFPAEQARNDSRYFDLEELEAHNR